MSRNILFLEQCQIHIFIKIYPTRIVPADQIESWNDDLQLGDRGYLHENI